MTAGATDALVVAALAVVDVVAPPPAPGMVEVIVPGLAQPPYRPKSSILPTRTITSLESARVAVIRYLPGATIRR